MTSLQELYDTFLRPLNLTWALNDASRRRLILVGALPAAVIVAELTQSVLEYVYGEGELFYSGFADDIGDQPPELWQRIYRAAAGLGYLYPAATGVLFLAGVGKWSRAEGSWMLMGGVVLITIAVALSLMATIVFTTMDDQQLIFDLGVYAVWFDMSQTFGLMSLGFLFVAYRGLSSAAGEPPAVRVEPPTSDL